MKISILTITPNIGFGGIMQAFALQSVLQGIMPDANIEIISWAPKYNLKARVIFFLSALKKRILKRQFAAFTQEGAYAYISQNTAPFVNKHLNLSPDVYNAEELHLHINANTDILVIGSDQVWRPKYVKGIENYFADGIDAKVRRIAYAASLGVCEWEYDEQQTSRCAQLIRSFVYVSVREQSAVSLIKRHLGFNGDVHWDLDPTLLANPEIYKPFVKSPKVQGDYVFTYILDANDKKLSVVDKVAETLHCAVHAFNTKAEHSASPLKERVAPAVEDWLSGIRHAGYVVTDSFHGTAFSIIFNKPFLVYVNKARGADRFESILSMLGLHDRMIFSPDEYNQNKMLAPIDWQHVNQVLVEKRAEILQRFSQALL